MLAGFSALLALLLERPVEVPKPVRVPPPPASLAKRISREPPQVFASLDPVRLGRTLQLPPRQSWMLAGPRVEPRAIDEWSHLPIQLLRTSHDACHPSALFRLPNGLEYEAPLHGEIFGARLLQVRAGEVTLLEGDRITRLSMPMPR